MYNKVATTNLFSLVGKRWSFKRKIYHDPQKTDLLKPLYSIVPRWFFLFILWEKTNNFNWTDKCSQDSREYKLCVCGLVVYFMWFSTINIKQYLWHRIERKQTWKTKRSLSIFPLKYRKEKQQSNFYIIKKAFRLCYYLNWI